MEFGIGKTIHISKRESNLLISYSILQLQNTANQHFYKHHFILKLIYWTHISYVELVQVLAWTLGETSLLYVKLTDDDSKV